MPESKSLFELIKETIEKARRKRREAIEKLTQEDLVKSSGNTNDPSIRELAKLFSEDYELEEIKKALKGKPSNAKSELSNTLKGKSFEPQIPESTKLNNSAPPIDN